MADVVHVVHVTGLLSLTLIRAMERRRKLSSAGPEVRTDTLSYVLRCRSHNDRTRVGDVHLTSATHRSGTLKSMPKVFVTVMSNETVREKQETAPKECVSFTR